MTSKRQNSKRRIYKESSFPKEQAEIADLYKPALNKIMTTNKYCVKYNFVSSLIEYFSGGVFEV